MSNSISTSNRLQAASWISASLVRKIGLGLIILAGLMLMAMGSVYYQVKQQESDSIIINIAGRQRMLSQRIANRTLRAIDGDAQAKDELQAATALFEQSLKGLQDGSTEMGLPPASTTIRSQLGIVDKLWQPFYQNVQIVLEVSQAGGQVQVLALNLGEGSEELLSTSEAVVTSFKNAGADGAIVDVAGRQRMLSQRMAKLALQISQGEAEVTPQLVETAQLFDESLQAMLKGDEIQGFPPASGTVREQLLAVETIWDQLYADIRSLVAAAENYETGLTATRAVIEGSEPLLQESNKAVTLFEQEAQGKVSRLQLFLAGITVVFLLVFAVVLWRTWHAIHPLNRITEVLTSIASHDLVELKQALQQLARGDLTGTFNVAVKPIDLKSNDEVGRTAIAFNTMVEQLHESSEAFKQTMVSLHHLVGQVADNARDVGESSRQLAAAADQSGQATTQIAATMQHVAQGTEQQTHNVSRISSVVKQVSETIEEVAKGAQEQAEAVIKSVEIANKIADAIRQVKINAQTGNKSAAEAAQIARHGAETVEETIKKMITIKTKVGISTQKVQEMGQRSAQIGAIIGTIDDIASQTNLLALNAAIEAARAGEHGKGFAVVADEVRKLAEKSAIATKEIAGLIQSIQQTVAEAVTAMEEGAAEVEGGASRANDASQALVDILKAVETVNQQVEDISTAAQKMSFSSNVFLNISDAVLAMVNQNTTATTEMASGSSEVSQAINNIADVSKANSAAVEEVSAATEEMSAQVEEVSASAQTLDDMAQLLLQLMAQFKLPTGESPHKKLNTVKVESTKMSMQAELMAINGHQYKQQPWMEIEKN